MNNLNTTIRHRELIATVEGSTFEAYTKEINPGLQSFTPWLSPIASNYESYKIKSMSFEFIPQVSTNTDGCIYMAIDYDAADKTAITTIK